MQIETFIREFHPGFEEYCPCILSRDGDITECKEGHLEELIRLSNTPDILRTLPADVSPLFYLTDFLGAVSVDYETQIYSGSLSQEQRRGLKELEKAGLIRWNPVDIKRKIVT